MISDLIRNARKAAKLTQEELSERTGIAREQISRYEKGRVIPETDTIIKIANGLDIPLTYFLGESSTANETTTQDRRYFSIPILGTVPAGVPFEAIENILEYEDLPVARFSPSHQYFGLKVKGDSMEPEYLDGDTVILRKQESCESGDDCAVMVNGDDATFKRVRVGENGITLQPLNYQKYEPRFFTAKEVRNLPVRIIGVVVEIRRRVKH